MIEEYFYKNKSSPDNFYPYCKKCILNKYQENKEEYNKKRVENARKNRERSRAAIKKSKMKKPEKYKLHSKIWRENHPEKIREYNLKRKMHKTHDISDEEWYSCLDYFNNSCAYCGTSEKEQYDLYNESLHMEHVIHDGSNYIDNCVPSCTRCNTSKRDFDFNDWYNENNEVYSKRRYNKIINWMTKECFKVLNLK
jgi:hypothetical protein